MTLFGVALSLLLIVGGLALILAKDTLWGWQKSRHERRGIRAERTAGWETSQTVLGVVFIATGLIGLLLTVIGSISLAGRASPVGSYSCLTNLDNGGVMASMSEPLEIEEDGTGRFRERAFRWTQAGGRVVFLGDAPLVSGRAGSFLNADAENDFEWMRVTLRGGDTVQCFR